MRRFIDFKSAIEFTQAQLLTYGDDMDPGHWQGVSTEGRPDMVTRELRGVAFTVPMPKILYPEPLLELAEDIQPNLPWADDHFDERVSRVPSNPGEQYKNWPWWHLGSEKTTMRQINQTDVDQFDVVFDHTYQERYWPKQAGHRVRAQIGPIEGIRYEYGDLDDVINLLLREPYTRQAYLPVFFPEDTGAVHGGRIPCTLGYQFLYRHKKLHMWYSIRSCDLVRHFRDDLYLSARLLLWVIEEWRLRMDDDTLIDDISPGDFTFVCPSMHVHKGDLHHVQS